MKLNAFNKYILIISILIISVSIESFSQGTDLSQGKKPGLYISASVIPGKSIINIEDVHGVSGFASTKEVSVSGSLSVGYRLSSGLGFSAGLGFSKYKTVLTLDSYQDNYTARDSENESFEMRVTGTGISEEQNMGFLTIPLSIYYSFPITESLGLYAEPGLILGIPLSNEYLSSGTFTSKGYYATYNVLLENMPAYGFVNSKSTNTAGEMEIKSMIMNAAVSAGIEYVIKEKIRIGAGIFYSRSLSSISEYTSTSNFRLTSDQGQINSMMGSADKVILTSFGAKITLRYFIIK